jgi:uncharacterized protein YbcI
MKGSKGELEDKISKTLTQWEKDYLGRGPMLVKTDIIRNMIVVLLKGILTPAEQQIAETQEGMLSIKRLRAELVESGKKQLTHIIKEVTGEQVISFHTDISTRTGERIMVFILHEHLENKLS